MPSVWIEPRRNKHGRAYMVRWETIVNGVRSRGAVACGPSKALAEQVRAKKTNELLHHKVGIDLPCGVLPWPEFSIRYLEHCQKHKAKRTFNNFDRPAILKFTSYIGNRPISAITTDDIGGWENRLLETYGRNTARMFLRCLRTAFRYAQTEKFITSSPTFHMPKEELVGRVLNDMEVGALLKELPPLLKAPVIFALYTGVRRGELLSLAWDRVRKAHEGHTEAEIGGIGGYQTKTGKSRLIPLHPTAVKAMGPPVAGRVFGGVNETNLSHGFKEATQRAGLGRVRIHDLRHTWATKFMQATGDMFGLMQLGGWTSVNSVARYQHLTRARAQQVFLVNYGQFPTNSTPK